RLEIGVRDGPGGRDAVLVLALAEVALPEAEHRRAVELGVAADIVVLPRPKALRAARPRLVAAVAQVAEHRLGVAVLRLPRQHGAALEDKHTRAAAGELVGPGAAADTGADDDDVVGHSISVSVIASTHTSLVR